MKSLAQDGSNWRIASNQPVDGDERNGNGKLNTTFKMLIKIKTMYTATR